MHALLIRILKLSLGAFNLRKAIQKNKTNKELKQGF